MKKVNQIQYRQDLLCQGVFISNLAANCFLLSYFCGLRGQGLFCDGFAQMIPVIHDICETVDGQN